MELNTTLSLFQVRKSFFAELGIYENETFIRQVYTDFILGKANHSNENFEVRMKSIFLFYSQIIYLSDAQSGHHMTTINKVL